MARIRATRGNFITGKLSVEAQANTDSEVYNFGLELCENFLLKPLGGAYKRSGTEYLRFLLDGYAYENSRIKFFEYYCNNTKILCFLSGVKDGGESANTSFGYLTEDGDYNTFELTNYEDGPICYVKNEDIDDVISWTENNIFHLLIPKLVDTEHEKEYGNIFTFSYIEGGFILDYGGFAWESEPLFPIDYGQQLLVSCVSEDALPWEGDLKKLKIYADLLNKDGVPIDSEDILNKFINLNVLFKFIKTQTYPSDGPGEDRDLAHSDRFVTGTYWIGARIKKSELQPSPYFELELKEEIQKQLFPITVHDDVGNRNKKSQISQWFVTAFNKKKPGAYEEIIGYLGEYPKILLPYKGRLYIFYKNWIFGSALGKSMSNFAMGGSSDDAFCVGWGDGKIGYVKWAFAASKMIIGASGGIFFSDSIVQNSGEQTSYQLPEMLTNISPSNVLPTLIGQSIIFVGSDNRSVYEIKLGGQEGPSVSKINSHCMGLFTEDITKITSDNDYLYATGDGGQCNVCCFAQTGFARRWFTYTFGGTAACLYDIYFNSLLPRSLF